MIKDAIAKAEQALNNPELDRDEANKVIKQLVKALSAKPKKDIDVPSTSDKPGKDDNSGTNQNPDKDDDSKPSIGGNGSNITKPGGSSSTKPGSNTVTANPSKTPSKANTGVESRTGLFGSLGVGAVSLAGIATFLYRKRENEKGLKKVSKKKRK